MSLEAAIEKNTEALTALLAHLQAGGAPINFTTTTAGTTKGSAKKPSAAPVEAASTGAASAAGATSDATPVGPTYDQVKEAVMKLSAKKGRDAAVAVLKAQGAAKVPDLKPEQYAAVLDDVNARLAV